MADITSKYQRFFAVTSDQYGVDPLRDKIVPQLMKITNFTTHDVLQDERAAPDLISLREYGSDEFWWIILNYNGLCSYRNVIEGISLRIPAITDVIATVTNNAVTPNVTPRVVTI